jgi:DNA-binding MarR family transcriptional regulator
VAPPATARKVRRAAASKAPTAASGAGPSEPLGELRVAFRHAFRALNRLRGRDTHLGGSELTTAQFELLAALDEHGELAAGELALAAHLTPASVTPMLDALAQSGHVARDRSPSDRRVVVSRLTPRGRREIAAKRKVWSERWERALEDVPEADLRAAARVLERVTAMLGEQAPERACGRPGEPGRHGRKTALR